MTRAAPSVCFALALLIVGCSSTTRQLEQEDRSSAELSTRIKAALIEARSVSAAAVGIELVDDSVILTGFVESLDEARRVERIAAEVAGEVRIENRLTVP